MNDTTSEQYRDLITRSKWKIDRLLASLLEDAFDAGAAFANDAAQAIPAVQPESAPIAEPAQASDISAASPAVAAVLSHTDVAAPAEASPDPSPTEAVHAVPAPQT